jgi:hypothetical protein
MKRRSLHGEPAMESEPLFLARAGDDGARRAKGVSTPARNAATRREMPLRR